MDQVETYRTIIKDLIRKYAEIKPTIGKIEVEAIFDEANDHYELRTCIKTTSPVAHWLQGRWSSKTLVFSGCIETKRPVCRKTPGFDTFWRKKRAPELLNQPSRKREVIFARLLMYTGWEKHRRLHGCVLHIDIRGGKVWIQHDGIEGGVAGELLEAGIPREHIVLGFKPETVRPYTDFAVA